MKRAVIAFLKVAVPLAIGVYLVLYFYDALNAEQREQLFIAFRQADPKWLLIATVIGWCSHAVRAWRWGYLLEPLGHRTGFWNRYHAVMIGYFMNLFIPRAGEASRPASLQRTEKVPFEQGFGTTLAERVVDVAVLLLIALVTLLMQLDKIDLFKERIAAFRAEQPTTDTGSDLLWMLVLAVLVIGGGVAAVMVYRNERWRARLMDLLRGFSAGLTTVLRTPHKGAFIAHSLLIWACYFAMFQCGLFCLPSTAEVPLAGVLAAFVAGAIGIVLVQGGIGVYPAFVGLIITVYMGLPEGGGSIQPDALAVGWLLWLVQTLVIIVLGGVSLLLLALKRPSP